MSKFNKKYEREGEKGGERKCWISVMWISKFLCPIPAARVWSVLGVPKVKKKKKKLWQTNCGNAIAEIGKKNCKNCGNSIAKNGGKKMVPKSGEE